MPSLPSPPFSLRSLGAASDLAALGPEAQIVAHSDRVVARMPALPDYWSGNVVLFRTGKVRAAEQIAQFRADVPEATHVALAWDDPRFCDRAGLDGLGAEGFDVDVDDVLTQLGPAPEIECPAGVELRSLHGDADWAAAIALQVETAHEDGYDMAAHAPFVAKLMEARRRHADAGGLRWFGAFEGDALQADLGVIATPGFVRFQAVETRRAARRRGIASALVAHASNRAAREAPGAPQVIVAKEASDAGRVYRRLGFDLAERIASAVVGSYGRTR